MSFFPKAPSMSKNDRPEDTSTALSGVRSVVASVILTLENLAKKPDSIYVPYLKALIKLLDVVDILVQKNESSQKVTVLPPSNNP